MTATALRVEEQAAPYLVAPQLTDHLDTFASTPEGFKRLRELVLNLAVRGKLVPQDSDDEPATELLKRVCAQARIKREGQMAEIGIDEPPYHLPQGWQWARLSQLLSKIGAGSTPLGGKEVYVSSGVKFLRSQNVWNEGLRLTDTAYITPETHEKMSGTRVLPNDLLFNITGASIGRCAVVPGTIGVANVSQHVTIVRPVLRETVPYLHLVLISSHVQQTVMDVQVGVSREGLSIGKLGRFVIPIPPLAEQSRIVAKVEELMALIAALEAKVGAGETARGKLLDTLLAALADSPDAAATAEAWAQLAPHFDLLLQTPADVDRLQQTLLQLAVKGRLVPQDPKDEPAAELLKRIRSEKARLVAEGKIKREKSASKIDADDEPFSLPNGWAWTCIATLAEIGTGTTPSRTEASFYTPPEIPWVTSGETSQSLIFDTREKVSQRALRETSLKLYPPHSLLVALYGQGKTRGQVSELMIAATTNQACAVIVLHGVAFGCKSYIKLYFQQIYEQLRELAAGGAQPNLNVGKVADTLIPLPPLPEQSRIVAAVASLTALCDRLRERLAARRELSAKLAAALTESALA